MPLGEVLFDFYGKLKMITRGYGSFDYVPIEYRSTDVVKVDILVNKEPIDALAYLVHRDKARARALHYCEQLAEAIPRHQFKIPIQGAIGGTIIARATIQPYRKDVTAKLYGGDVTRKKKLLEKQKKGKAKMKQFWQRQHSAESFCLCTAGRQGLGSPSLDPALPNNGKAVGEQAKERVTDSTEAIDLSIHRHLSYLRTHRNHGHA